MANNTPIIMAFGTSDYVKKINEANGIVREPDKSEKEVVINSPKGAQFIIADCDSNREVTDEEIALLDNVIVKHDFDEVYMQDDPTFYDNYYMSDSAIDNELLKAVRGIRRIYRDYEKYLYACYLRDYYLDMIDEEYGDDYSTSIMKLTNERTVQLPPDVFLPPSPIYSRNSDDYDNIMNNGGISGLIVHQASDDEADEFVEEWEQSHDIDVSDMSVVGGLVTDRRVISGYYDYEDSHGTMSLAHPQSAINVSDMDSIKKLVQSWHKTGTDQKPADDIKFPDSVEGIIEQNRRYLGETILQIMKDESKVPDDNEMITDEVTNKIMTRKEYNIRQSLRTLADIGDWDIIKLMKQGDVGSKFERSMMTRKASKNKKAKKKAKDFFLDVTGMGSAYDEYEAEQDLTVEELAEYLLGGSIE